jgi:hypothetical protein
MPQSIVAYSHVFVLPPNTAGTAKLQGRKIRRVNPPSDLLRPPFLAALEPQIQPPTPVFPTPPFIPPLLPQPLWSVPQPYLPALQPAGASVVHVPYLPYTTTHYRKKKREEEEKTGFNKRKYTRSSATILCRQCQRERDCQVIWVMFSFVLAQLEMALLDRGRRTAQILLLDFIEHE